jgi:hypothetical protein
MDFADLVRQKQPGKLAQWLENVNLNLLIFS